MGWDIVLGKGDLEEWVEIFTSALRTMDFSNTVELLEKLYRIRERLLWRDELGRNPLLEADCDIGRLVGSFQRVVGHGPHVIWRRLIRVFRSGQDLHPLTTASL